MLVTSILFNSSNAPTFFSHRIYLVETEAFSLVKNGSALVAKEVGAEEITAGNIIIFSDDTDEARIGEVQEVTLEEAVYTFRIKNDLGEEMTVGQSHILGKGIYYSELTGKIISFAMSPLGVCCIAVLPCLAFIVSEIIASVKRNALQSDFEIVKKQNEVPTYLPSMNYDSPEERLAFSDGRERLMEAAGLFTPPQKKPSGRQPEERAPISGRDIDKLIKETKARHFSDAMSSDMAAPEQRSRPIPPPPSPAPRPNPAPRQPILIDEEDTRNIFESSVAGIHESANRAYSEQAQMPAPTSRSDAVPKKESDTAKQYEPQRRTPPKLAPRVSRLDSLLQEETNDSHYDIDDILKSLEKNS